MCKLSDKVGQHMRKKSTGCKYSCHAACRDRVSLDCHPAASPISQDQLNNNTQLHVSTPLHCTGFNKVSVGVRVLSAGAAGEQGMRQPPKNPRLPRTRRYEAMVASVEAELISWVWSGNPIGSQLL
ncbi:ras association domain-containing protein 3 isoform X1 [Lates japonicus]|uniref:Ras association domain-containing protein 3 isoform X1 n=1 Tax=Lates japonicus TaxID=270547 RepID=A0AAD3NJ68_LATJO|nr:ras association domain-containing protein 3 isoform X1 [Lates japonicus]